MSRYEGQLYIGWRLGRSYSISVDDLGSIKYPHIETMQTQLILTVSLLSYLCMFVAFTQGESEYSLPLVTGSV